MSEELNPFKLEDLNNLDEGPQFNKIDIRIQPRGNRKFTTTISGLDPKLDLDKIIGFLKKTCNCNGTVQSDEKFGKVLVLQGDQRERVRNFLISEEICSRENISIHGF